MTDKVDTLKKLGLVLETCPECGKRFRFKVSSSHSVVALDTEEDGEPYDDDTGFFCSRECGVANAERRRANGEEVAYYYFEEKP